MALSRKNAPDDLNGTVPPLCKEIWAIRRHTKRADPFIGLTTLADAKYLGSWAQIDKYLDSQERPQEIRRRLFNVI